MAAKTQTLMADDGTAIKVQYADLGNGFWAPAGFNAEGNLLPSAARTATLSTPNQTNPGARGVILTLNVTANPGGVETLTLQLQNMLPTDPTITQAIAASIVSAAASNGTYRLYVYPGASGALPNAANNVCFPLPVARTWLARVVHSASGSWTYSVDFQYCP